ncbi:hypothetical protein SAMN05444851_2009 [Aliiroseovarius sediminilitoris]|uniref:Uncharacterized protein n=1 Tax=Aliiroseovarius sediminilitoris TaxID=1173584 RepID=A0A1I0PX85_9RHOB|nr:hypothetical protein SAMN05444851_2009 [Aliiroseovarius sediminilitoris]
MPRAAGETAPRAPLQPRGLWVFTAACQAAFCSSRTCGLLLRLHSRRDWRNSCRHASRLDGRCAAGRGHGRARVPAVCRRPTSKVSVLQAAPPSAPPWRAAYARACRCYPLGSVRPAAVAAAFRGLRAALPAMPPAMLVPHPSPSRLPSSVSFPLGQTIDGEVLRQHPVSHLIKALRLEGRERTEQADEWRGSRQSSLFQTPNPAKETPDAHASPRSTFSAAPNSKARAKFASLRACRSSASSALRSRIAVRSSAFTE